MWEGGFNWENFLFICFCLVMVANICIASGNIGNVLQKTDEQAQKCIIISSTNVAGSLVVLIFALMTYMNHQTDYARIAGMDTAIALAKANHACFVPKDTLNKVTYRDHQ